MATENPKYVGYLNDSDLFIEEMYDPKKNPNGIGKIKICVNSSGVLLNSFSEGGMNDFFYNIFGLNNRNKKTTISDSNYGEKTKNNGYNITKVIKFIASNDFKLGGSSEWGTSIDDIMKEMFGGSIVSTYKKSGFGGGKLGAGAKLAAGLSGIKFQTLLQTINFWEGSKVAPFEFPFILLATAPDIDIRRDLLALYATVFPVSLVDAYNSYGAAIIESIKSGSLADIIGILTGGALSGFMSAPLGYSPVSGYNSSLSPTTTEGSGLIDIRLGKWLHIPNLIAESFDATISKVTTRYGFPLYADCTLRVKPCRMWTASDIYDIFFSTTVSDEEDKGQGGGYKTYNIEGGLDEGEIVHFGEMP